VAEELGSKRAVVRSSGIYVILGFLPLGINVLLAPIYTSYLSPADYGIIGLAQIFNGLISVFIGAGINQSYARFYFDQHRDGSARSTLLLLTVGLISMIAVALFPILWYFGDSILGMLLQNSNFKFSNYGYIVYITATATVLVGVLQSFYRNEEKPIRYSILSLSFFLLSLAGILLGVVYYEAGAMGNIIGRASGTGVVAMWLVLLIVLSTKWKFDRALLRSMLAYGIPLIPYALILLIFNAMDRWFVEHYFGLEKLGFYNFAFVLASSVSVFLYSVYNAVSPRVFKLLTSDLDREKINQEVRLNLELLSLGVLLFVALALLCTPLFLNYLIAEQYRGIDAYLGLLFIAYVMQLYYVIYTIPFYYEKRTRFLPVIAVSSLVLGALAYFFGVRYFGFYGIFIGLFATKLIQVLSTLILVRFYGKFRLDYLNLKRIHVSSFLSVFSVICLFFLASRFHWPSGIEYYLSGLVMIAICLVVYASKLSPLFKTIKKMTT